MKHLKYYENVEVDKTGRPKFYIDPSDGRVFRNLRKMLCINNYIGELTNKYDFTVGKLYDIEEYSPYCISFKDDLGYEQFFEPNRVCKNFSPEQSWEDYQSRVDAKKFGII